MKNLVIALSLFFALGASAQSKSAKTTKAAAAKTTTATAAVNSIEASAQKNLDDLAAFTPVNAQQKDALKDLFMSKYQMLKEIEGMAPERKIAVREGMEYRLTQILDAAAIEKVRANKSLYESLIN